MIKTGKIMVATIFAIFVTSCYGQKNNTMDVIHQDVQVLENGRTYEIWEICNVSYDGGERDEIHVNKELIASLPDGVKAIITRYSTFIPEYIWESNKDSEKDLANSLGGFSSLENAQKTLLKKWGKEFSLPKKSLFSLEIRESGQSIVFEYSLKTFNKKRDEFKVGSKGKIAQVFSNKVLEPIVYDKLKLFTYYSATYKIKLNGEEIKVRNYYLDPDNIESIALCREDETVYIEQKNKTPKYFSLSDIDLAELSYPVKSLDEITYISLDDGLERGFHDYHNEAKIEASAIIGFKSWIKDNVKYLQIKTKLNN